MLSVFIESHAFFPVCFAIFRTGMLDKNFSKAKNNLKLILMAGLSECSTLITFVS